MGGDMVTALGRAASGANTLFGHNSSRPADEPQALVRSPGRSFALGEKVRTQHLELSQARQTFTAVGTQGRGLWGFHHGANEHGVAAGCTGITTRLRGDGPGLTGPDLVRLALERGRTARQALDLVADLVCRHTAEGPGVALLLADPREAFLLEAGGPYWACQEVGEVRAVSEAGTIRQDWNTLARGFSSHALSQGWWPGDGSKLDFTAAVNPDHAGREPALRRWGRVTLLLEQQNGRIDAVFLRRLLGDHFEGCPDEVDPLADEGGPTPVCQHGNAGGRVTAASLVAVLPGGDAALPLAWWSFGPPCTAVYFPVFLDGELPEEFGWPVPGLGESVWERGRRLLRHVGSDADRWHLAREGMTRLQGAIDQKTEEFAAEAAAWKRRGERAELARSAGMFLRHLIEQFEEAVDGLLGVRPPAPSERDVGKVIARVQSWWAAARRPARAPVPYEVSCDCGHVLRGLRKARHQVVACPACRQDVFILGASPLPSPDAPAARPAPSAWRMPLLAGGITLAAVAAAFVVLFFTLPPKDESADPTAGPEALRAHITSGRQALADGKFRRAVLELDAACQLRRQHPDWLPAGESHELDQLHRQAAALADLLTEYLGDILLRASRTQEDEWADQFALRYKGDDRPNVLLLDARVQRDAAGAYHVDYQVEAGAEPARLEVGDLKLLHGLPLEGPTRLLFAARLASVAREPPGVWVVRLEPDSGVLLTDAAAVAACWAEPLPEDVLQVLARQREWLRGRPQLSRGHSAAPARRRDGTPGQA